MNGQARGFTVLTYNIHRCRGTDGRYDPERVAELIREVNADVVGLQEVDARVMLHQLDFLAGQAGYKAVEGFVRLDGRGIRFGNALLTRHPIRSVRKIDLTVRGASERRGAVDVDLIVHDRPVRVIVAHLGLQVWERHFQIARLLRELGHSRTEQIVMMGDFNLLVSVLPKLRRFNRRLGHTPLLRTFPSRFPILSLDRIWTQPARSLVRLHRIQTPLTRLASDHLPLTADIVFPEYIPSHLGRAGRDRMVL